MSELSLYVNDGGTARLLTSTDQYPGIDARVTAIEEVVVPNSAAAHNGFYRGKNLTDVYTLDELSAKIQANDWSDLFIGDYIEVPMTTSIGGTETVRWLFAGFDIYLNRGDTALTKHHIAMVPEDCFKTGAQMNETNTTEGGYYGSVMHQTTLPTYASALAATTAFGSHLATYRALLSNAISATTYSASNSSWAGATTGFAWYDTQLCLLSEIQVYGANIHCSSRHDIGHANQQLPLFALAPDKLIAGNGLDSSGRWTWWLSSVASSANFCLVGGYGISNAAGASGAAGVRPLLLFI